MGSRVASGRRRSSLLWTFAFVAVLASCRSVEPRDAAARGPASGITVEWFHGEEARAIDDVARFAWRPDGSLLLFDERVPAARRTFEACDPATGARVPLVDRAAAVASLEALVGDAAAAAWDWPSAFDEALERALYLIEDDVFVLDLTSASFLRLTESAEAETCVSFSPDGSRVAFVRANDLYVVELGDGTAPRERRLTHDGSETTLNGTLSWVYWEEIFGRRDIGTWWSPDSRSIAYLHTDESRVGIARFLDPAPPYARLIEQRYPKAGTENPTVRVRVVELEGGSSRELPWPRDAEYLARVNWLADGRLSYQTMTRDQRRLELHLADLAGGGVERVLTETDAAWVNIHDDLYFLADGEHFLWASERDGYAHLYLYRLPAGGGEARLVRQVTEGEWSLAASGGGVFWLRQSVCAIDEARGWVYFTARRESSIERHLYRARLDGRGEVELLTARRGTHAITFDAGAERFVDRFSSLASLPSLGVHAADGTPLVTLAYPRPELLAPLDLQVPELLSLPARDGFPMPAWIMKPADFDPGRRYPLILYVYGGPSAPSVANAWDDDRFYDQLLLDQGYLVARCDPRNATAISKTLESTILHRSIGDVERDDYVDAVGWFKARPWVDPARVGIWGWSGGGSMTLLMLTRSEEFRAGISVAPVTDWRTYDTKWAEFTMKLPSENADGYAHTNLVERAKDLHGRLLMVHGTYDDNVHPQNTLNFADALIEAGIPFDMMLYPMRKHGIRDTPARIHLYEKMVEFWRTHL